MNEMIERVALALFLHDNNADWDALIDEFKRPWRDQAKVAIAALREPTEAMIEAGRAEAGTEEFGMRRAYQAMMDEARK